MSESYIKINDGSTAFVGPDATELVRAVMIAKGIKLYLSSGMILTRGVTITRMLGMAERYTGKKYGRGRKDQQQAQADVEKWCETMKSALPVVTEHPK